MDRSHLCIGRSVNKDDWKPRSISNKYISEYISEYISSIPEYIPEYISSTSFLNFELWEQQASRNTNASSKSRENLLPSDKEHITSLEQEKRLFINVYQAALQQDRCGMCMCVHYCVWVCIHEHPHTWLSISGMHFYCHVNHLDLHSKSVYVFNLSG